MLTALRVMEGLVASVPQPKPSAPAGVQAGVDKILGLVMYISIAMAVCMFLAAGAWAWAGNNGHGNGISPQLQSKVMGGIVALIIIAGASSIANFFL